MNIFNFFKKENDKNNNSKQQLKTRKIIYFEEHYMRCLDKYDLNIKELSKLYNQKICINCGTILDIELKNSRNCPECRAKIILKTDPYSRERIMLSEELLNNFEKYSKEVKEIIYMDKIIKDRQFIYKEYMSKFYSIKENNTQSARDIVYQFSNYVASDIDRKAYTFFMLAKKMPEKDMILKSFSIVDLFKRANNEYAILFNICMFKKKYNVAIYSLADIIYRDIQIESLYSELNTVHTPKKDDYVYAIVTRMKSLKDLIHESNYSLNDFKEIFIKQGHPFILPRISNELSWKYVEATIKKFNIKFDE